MQQRHFGKRTGFEVSPVSIGAMRLPQDTDEAVELLRYAIDAGMNYIDTSRGYADSEIKVGKALKDGYRGRVMLSTKWAPWTVRVDENDDASADCIRRRIEEQMQRLQVDYLDFYQVWTINNREHWETITAKGNTVDGILKAIDEGLVGHTGFTTHDTPANLFDYVREADWAEVVLMSFNLMNSTYREVLADYHNAGIGTIVMNPVGGGKLAEPSPVLLRLAEEVGAASVPELALRYLLGHRRIATLIVGISKKSDVDGAVAAANAGGFSKDEMARIDAFIDAVNVRNLNFCTGCRYCMPCPEEVDIPGVLAAVYEERFWGLADSAQRRYDHIEGGKADACTACGQCETKCTQQIAIIDEMKHAREKFGAGA